MLCDRRRLARAPHPTSLTLEQLSLLPLQGIPTSRVIRAQLQRRSRAIIMDAHIGVPALICQALSRAGVAVTAIIGGGEENHDAQSLCMTHGAKGVLTGSPAAVMMGLDESGWDFVLDTTGGVRVYDAAKRMLKNGGK
jgi:NADPH:quinone reductase-like Zn-dependent oxidoreductase